MSKEFLEAEYALFRAQAREVDIVITTALIPGKPAPKLITADMVKSMKPGSVIVDMAGEQGGNCELTVPGEVVVRHGVTIIGYTDLVSRLAKQSSTLYSNNLLRLAEELCKAKDGVIDVNMEDDAIRGLTVIKDGTVTWPAPPPKLPAVVAKPPSAPVAAAKSKGHGHGVSEPMAAKSLAIVFGAGALAFLLVGLYAPATFLSHFTVFVLACFVGYMVVWSVTPSLHTPLMSVTKAISSIIAIGALVQVAPPLLGGAAADRPSQLILGLAVFALALTAVNMFGGFAVTRRMLAMFRK
jgi:NAD(P) transhydrogenase subunit alpha